MANAANRETVRDALTTLLSTALTGVGNPVQSVYGYHISEFGGDGFESPVVLVLSNGSRRERRGLGTQVYRTFFQLSVLVFVSDAIAAESWTDANVEDRLDLLGVERAVVGFDPLGLAAAEPEAAEGIEVAEIAETVPDRRPSFDF